MRESCRRLLVPPALQGSPGYVEIVKDASVISDRARSLDVAQLEDLLVPLARTVTTIHVLLSRTVGGPLEHIAAVDSKVGWCPGIAGGGQNAREMTAVTPRRPCRPNAPFGSNPCITGTL